MHFICLGTSTTFPHWYILISDNKSAVQLLSGVLFIFYVGTCNGVMHQIVRNKIIYGRATFVLLIKIILIFK